MGKYDSDETAQSVKGNASRGAFEVALEAARLENPVVRGEDGREHLFVPNGFSALDVTDPYRLKSSAHVNLTFDLKRSLIEYVNRFGLAGSVLLADVDAGTIRAVIDYHAASDKQKPGSVGGLFHSATFKLRPSEEWLRWNKFEGDLHGQAEFASFLEENAVDIKRPDPADMIEISRDLEAVQGAEFKGSVRLANGDRSFAYATETKTKNDVVVPQSFVLDIPLYAGEERIELEAALRWRPTGEGIKFGFEWRRVKYQQIAYFQQIATEIVEGTGVPVFYGR